MSAAEGDKHRARSEGDHEPSSTPIPWHAIWHRRWLVSAVALITLAATIIYLLVATPTYTVTSSLRVDVSPGLEKGGETRQAVAKAILQTQCEVLGSSTLVAVALAKTSDEDASQLSSRVGWDRVQDLQNNLDISVGKESQIITVSLSSAQPEAAARFLNTLTAEYATYRGSELVNSTADTLKALHEERSKQLAQLEATNKSIIALKRDHGALSFENGADTMVTRRLASMSEAWTTAHLQTLAAKIAYDEAARSLPAEPPSTATAPSVPLAMDERNEAALQLAMTEWQQRLIELERRYLADHPLVSATRSRLLQLQRSYVASLEQRWHVAQTAEAQLQKSFEEQHKSAIGQSALAAEYAKHEGDLRRLERALDMVDSRIKQMDLASNAESLNISVLVPAMAGQTPSSPQAQKLLPAGCVLGLMLGAGLALMLEMLYPRLRSPQAISSALGVRVLGEVPQHRGAYPARLTLAEGASDRLPPRSEIADAMRTLRAALFYAPDSRDVVTLLVTSPSSGDGKSTLASNLAVTAAGAGERVLLIDADLRAPSQHRIFNTDNGLGLSSVIEDGVDWKQAVHKTSTAGVTLLSSGPIPVDPLALLNSQPFLQLLEDVATNYDRVIIDSPPLESGPDSRILAALSDGTLLVLRGEEVAQRAAQFACYQLSSIGARVVGIAVNGTLRPRGSGYGYGYRSRAAGGDLANVRQAARGAGSANGRRALLISTASEKVKPGNALVSGGVNGHSLQGSEPGAVLGTAT